MLGIHWSRRQKKGAATSFNAVRAFGDDNVAL
jgi:hypothetical protein